MMVRAGRRNGGARQRYEKVAITLPSQLLQAARAEAEAGRAGSLSAYIAQAIEEKVENDELQQVLDEIFAESPMTDAERAWADQYLLDR
ncbi:MAG TPA: hypothetical protein VNL16_04265 [Chloroflexota bacterium]|nr:hypothetical protein [Chloroflexota bacterium]